MPNGQRSFYVNDPRPGYYGAYEDHILKDVVGFVDATFPTVRGRQGRFIAGLSMGGYGALMLALRHPDVFSAACSHAGALAFAHSPRPDRPDIQALADSLPLGEYDIYLLAERLTASGQPLRERLFHRRLPPAVAIDDGRLERQRPQLGNVQRHFVGFGLQLPPIVSRPRVLTFGRAFVPPGVAQGGRLQVVI